MKSNGIDYDGMNNANESGYIGVGTASEFNVNYENVYHGISGIPGMGFRYDLFGQYSNIYQT